MSTTTISRINSDHSSFSNFTKWVKGSILKKSKKVVSTPDSTSNSRDRKSSTTISSDRSIIKSSSPSTSPRRTPSKRSNPSGNRRKSRNPNRRSGGSYLNEKNKNENFIIINNDSIKNNIYKNDDNNNNNIINKIINNDNNVDWVEEEILNHNYNNNNKGDLIIPTINYELKTDMYEISTVIGRDQRRLSCSSSSSEDSRDDFIENTCIIKGSVEHFAYIRTLRKLRRDRQRPTVQVIFLNNLLEKVSTPSKLSEDLLKELFHYKTRVYELNRLKRNSIFLNDLNSRLPCYNLNNSTSSLCPPPSLMNQRLSAIIAENRPASPITMKYRPSYASSKVVTVFDEESNKFVVKELPVARRKRRLSDLTLVRSTSSSSTTSTNSSQSSLITLTDDAEQLKHSTLTKEPDTFISNHITIRKCDDEYDGDEDDVPLFVLKEQFKYSGRGHNAIKNIPSLEGNKPLCMTLAV